MHRGELKRLILHEDRRFEEAQSRFQLALSLDPDGTSACSNLGRTLFVLGREARAEIVGQGEKVEAMAAANPPADQHTT